MEPILILTFAAIGAFWYASMQAREQAVRAVRRACDRSQVQLLDETVALQRLRLARDGNGRMRFRRIYGFEFSTDSAERREGWIELLGGRIAGMHLDMPEYTLHDPTPEE